MAITSDEIRNYPLTTDRRGYNVEEVDQLLDHVAEFIDELEATIAELRYQLDAKPTQVMPAPAPAPVVDEEAINSAVNRARADYERQMAVLQADANTSLALKDARIAELEAAIADARADGNAIAQALIIAQRSADEILSNANGQAVQIIDDAKEDAANILARAEEDKQAIIDDIDGLKVDMEDARAKYQDLLKDFISDATSKLAGISEGTGAHSKGSARAAAKVTPAAPVDPAGTGRIMSKAQIPVRQVSAETYVTPQTGNVIPVPATPTPSKVTKDLSGFGDADSDFGFGDID